MGHDASMSLYDYCNGDPVNGLDPNGRNAATSLAYGNMLNNMTPEQYNAYVQDQAQELPSAIQVFGAMRGVGGAAEAFGGYTLATASAGGGAATAPTGIGPVLGGLGVAGGVAIGAHGIDQMQSGFRQAWTGQVTDSATSTYLLQGQLGLSPTTANLTDAGISVVGSFGAGFGTTAIRATALSATASPDVASASLLTKIGYYELGQGSIDSASSYLQIPNTLDRGAAMLSDANGSWLQAFSQNTSSTMGIAEGTFPFGLTAIPTPLGTAGTAATFTLAGGLPNYLESPGQSSPSGDPLSSQVLKWK